MKNNRKKYPIYIDDEGNEKTVHSRVGEKKYGYDKIPKNFVIHHIDGDKDNNRYYNLILLHKKDHRRIHVKKTLTVKSIKPSENEIEE